MATQLRLKVVGTNKMHCRGCERGVALTLSQLPGVEEVKADHKTQLIEVKLTEAETGLDKVKEELDSLGYEVAFA